MSKEVLMSRRAAAMDTVDAARHSMGGNAGMAPAYQPPPISNYKGVMLCDRPTTKAPGGGRGSYTESGGQMPFACAVGPGSKYEALGLNPSREHRAAKLASDNRTRPRDNNDFLSKHRKWLAALNKQRQRKAEEDEAAINMAVEKTKKFKEYAAKLRSNIREAKAQHMDGNFLTEDAMDGESGGGRQSGRPPASGGNTSNKKSNAKKRPVWALTEEGVEDREEEELDDLLNFASGLDFDKYIEDYEVRNALAAVKDRIAELSKHKQRAAGNADNNAAAVDLDASGDDWKKAFVEGWNEAGGDNDRLSTARSDRSNASRMHTARTARSEQGDDARSVAASDRGEGDVPMDVAEAVLQTSRDMRKIHSSRSIRGIIEKKKAAKQQRRPLAAVAEEGLNIGATQAPPVTQVYHAEDQGVANGGNKGNRREIDPSNLPYLHRNPAI